MATTVTVPVVLCGGAGTRLWPLSRRKSPKQFLPLLDGRSLFDEAVVRALGIVDKPADNQRPVLCVTVDAHKYLVQDGLGMLGVKADILVEPVARNTAAALCLAALQLSAQYGNATMVVLPSDHVIEQNKQWYETIDQGVLAAGRDRWVCLGITPRHPSCEFGYIKQGHEHSWLSGAYFVDSFAEKPDTDTAKALCNQGWLWNAGIAIVEAKTVLAMIGEHAPDVYAACVAAMEKRVADEGFIFPGRAEYRKAPAVQIDKSVLEKSDNVSVIPFFGEWRDIGTWAAVEHLADVQGQGNRICGDVIIEDCRQVFVRSPDRLVVALGLENISIIDTPDALLVAHKNNLDGLGQVVKRLVGEDRAQADIHLRVARPWGHYDVKADEPGYKVKCVLVQPGAALSSQYHYHRAEHWIVVKGTATICCDGKEREVGINESVFIPQGTIHRLENRTAKPLELVEVQTGDYLGEDDIVRLEDAYGRV